MVLKILTYSRRHYYCNALLNIMRIVSPNRYMRYSLSLPVMYVHENNFKFVPSICSNIFYQFHSKISDTSVPSEVESLCQFILSENLIENGGIEELKKVITFLLSKGYSSKKIKEKFLDYLKSDNHLYAKFCILADIDDNIVMLLPLLSLPLPVLKSIANKAVIDRPHMKEFSNRIVYLSYHLELEPSQLIPALAKHSALLTMKFQRLDCKMNILKNASISPKYIVKDLWIFNYTEGLLASRIQAAMKAGVQLKPWMLRCSEDFFESMLFKYSETQRILNGEDVHSYLAKKLDCSKEYVNYMMERNRLLKSVNVPKLEQVINFLFSKGYTAEEIRIFPRVFCSSVKTLEKRFQAFQHVKSTLPTLAQLCLSNNRLKLRLTKNI